VGCVLFQVTSNPLPPSPCRACFTVGYVLFQVPSNLVLTRLGGPTWLPIIALSWGAVAASFAAMHSPASFYVLRLLLGIAVSEGAGSCGSPCAA